MSQLQTIIEDAFERRAEINPSNASPELKDAIASVLADLDAGKLRVASRKGDSKSGKHINGSRKLYYFHSVCKTTY